MRGMVGGSKNRSVEIERAGRGRAGTLHDVGSDALFGVWVRCRFLVFLVRRARNEPPRLTLPHEKPDR
jgi:hypothetical protein